MLATVGASGRKMVMDPSMPHCVNRFVGNTFDSVWPEIEKEMCDRYILNNGFSFRGSPPSAPAPSCPNLLLLLLLLTNTTEAPPPTMDPHHGRPPLTVPPPPWAHPVQVSTAKR